MIQAPDFSYEIRPRQCGKTEAYLETVEQEKKKIEDEPDSEEYSI